MRNDNSKIKMMFEALQNTILEYGTKHNIQPDNTLAALYVLEYALIYECKSTLHLTDEEIEKIKMYAKKIRKVIHLSMDEMLILEYLDYQINSIIRSTCGIIRKVTGNRKKTEANMMRLV